MTLAAASFQSSPLPSSCLRRCSPATLTAREYPKAAALTCTCTCPRSAFPSGSTWNQSQRISMVSNTLRPCNSPENFTMPKVGFPWTTLVTEPSGGCWAWKGKEIPKRRRAATPTSMEMERLLLIGGCASNGFFAGCPRPLPGKCAGGRREAKAARRWIRGEGRRRAPLPIPPERHAPWQKGTSPPVFS